MHSDRSQRSERAALRPSYLFTISSTVHVVVSPAANRLCDYHDAGGRVPMVLAFERSDGGSDTSTAFAHRRTAMVSIVASDSPRRKRPQATVCWG